jgi:flagellin
MPSVIYTNTASLAAQRNLLGAQNSLTTSVERLSSGQRINRAKDDAAGLGVAENLKKQLNGIKQGIQNINDGISMAQTAEGALSAASEMAQRIVTLATQGANETLSKAQRKSIYSEIAALQTAINDVSTRTTFTGTPLFAGNSLSLQVSNQSSDIVSVSSAALAKIGIATIATTGSGSGETLFNHITALSTAVNRTDVQTASDLQAVATAQAAYNLAQSQANLDALNAALGATMTGAFKNIQTSAANYLDVITSQRGTLGAFQNQLEYTVANLTDFSTNLSAARSRVIDTDYASETANLTKGQILQQAATAMLAQANQMPNVILTLMK